MKWLAETFLKLRGWQFIGEPPPEPRFIVVGAPHTSNWDFLIFLAAIRHWDLNPRYLGKHTLFSGPFGWLFRRWGGIPVDRSKPGGVIGSVSKRFQSNEEFALVIAPEGTREAAEYWKSGFIKIAEATGAAIVPAGVDFGGKRVILGEPIAYDGSPVSLMDTLREFYSGMEGKNPEGGGPVRVREERTGKS